MLRQLRTPIRLTLLALGIAVLAVISPSYADDPSDPVALVRAGYLYERGDGVAQDYKEAMRLYLLSAAQGNTVAQFRIGAPIGRVGGPNPSSSEAAPSSINTKP